MSNIKSKTMKCPVCDKTITYKTKKPKMCDKCKDNNNGNIVNNKWNNEIKMVKILEEMLPGMEYCMNGYYSWLRSPKEQPMQLDWYCEELGLAFEYNGVQHYKRIEKFQQSEKQFNYMQECDGLKKEECKKRDVTLVIIRFDLKLNKVSLATKIKEANETLYSQLLESNKLKLNKIERNMVI